MTNRITNSQTQWEQENATDSGEEASRDALFQGILTLAAREQAKREDQQEILRLSRALYPLLPACQQGQLCRILRALGIAFTLE